LSNINSLADRLCIQHPITAPTYELANEHDRTATAFCSECFQNLGSVSLATLNSKILLNDLERHRLNQLLAVYPPETESDREQMRQETDMTLELWNTARRYNRKRREAEKNIAPVDTAIVEDCYLQANSN
jgi:hypothetical protein